MLRSNFFILSSLFALALGVSVQHERILGGDIVESTEKYPMKCNLRYNGDFHCGCVIISDTYVLTSARCTEVLRPKNLAVLVGSNHINAGNETYDVANITNHYDFILEDFFTPDISILELSTPMTLNPSVGAATLPTQNQVTPSGATAVVIGWGYTADLGPYSPNLLEANATIMEPSACASWYANEGVINDRHVCTTNSAGGVCNGDNGGPLFVNGVLHGIVTWTSSECATVQGFPGVYTRVASFRDWIKDTTQI